MTSQKVGGTSLPEIKSTLKRAALDFEEDPDIVRVVHGHLDVGRVLNAFVLWCLSRPPDERKAIAVWGLRAMEYLLDSPVPIELRSLSQVSFDEIGRPRKDESAGEAAKPNATIARGKKRAGKARRTA